jgi:hypothetical protein
MFTRPEAEVASTRTNEASLDETLSRFLGVKEIIIEVTIESML